MQNTQSFNPQSGLQIKTASDLKYQVESRGTETHFFDRATMRYFGDTMRNYGVRKVEVVSEFDAQGNYNKEGFVRTVYELYRRRAVKHGNKKSAFFDAETFQQVFCILSINGEKC